MMSEQTQTITSEQAFDMLPYVADIYDKLQIDKYRKELQKKYKGQQVDPVDVGIEVIKYILKNSGKVKDEFFAIVAIVENRKVDEVKKQPFIQTLQSINRIFTDPELMGFFKQAME